MSWVFVATTAFLSECVPQQAAGAFALGNMLRNPGAAIAAVVIPSLTSKMGIGWCFTGLAILDAVLVGGAVLRMFASHMNNLERSVRLMIPKQSFVFRVRDGEKRERRRCQSHRNETAKIANAIPILPPKASIHFTSASRRFVCPSCFFSFLFAI